MPGKMELLWPELGVVRRFGHRHIGQRTAYGTPWSVNTRLEDSLTERLRGGSFTGISAVAKDAPVYRDRAITFDSNVITAARQGDSTDTSLATDVSDTQRPIIFQLALADVVGGTVVTVVPHKDSYLLCFTATETWILSGDPATGSLRRISDQVGIIGEDAWCVAHDTVYFLSARGLYSVSADGSGLKALSEDRTPEELEDAASGVYTLTYRHEDRGVYIHYVDDSPSSPSSGSTVGEHSWFYDTAREGFWPFNTDTTESHVLIGPLKLGSMDWQGLTQTLHGIIADGSATVNWRIVPGKTAEEAAENGRLAIEADLDGDDYSSYVQESGSWAAGRSRTARPRVTAMFVCLWLSSAGTWAFEGSTLVSIPAGNWRY